MRNPMLTGYPQIPRSGGRVMSRHRTFGISMVSSRDDLRHEGTMRDALLWDGRWVDCHLMALLDSDWAAPGTR